MKLLLKLRGSYGAMRIMYRLSWFINLFCRRFDRAKNRAERSRAELPAGLLNGQDVRPLADLPYGAWRIGRNGCEVIAAYNAFAALSMARPFDEIAAELENRRLLFNGFGGTNPCALPALFQKNGISVSVLRRRDWARFDAAFSKAECAVLSYWTGHSVRSGTGAWNTLHTVSVHHVHGGIEVCNVSGKARTSAKAPSIGAFLSANDGDPLCLLLLNRGNG